MPFSYKGPKNAGQAKAAYRVQFDVIKKNAKVAFDLFAYRAVEVASYMGIDLLANAQPRVPWDTGELRRSGAVNLQIGNRSLTLARGRKSGSISVHTGKLNMNSIGRGLSKKRGAKVFISYHRIKNGKDIGIWTHEVLNPHDTRPNSPAATKPGTGPKYLEIAFNERKNLWGELFTLVTTKGVEADLRKIANVIHKKKGQYEVDLIELVRSKIRKKGYFGGR